MEEEIGREDGRKKITFRRKVNSCVDVFRRLERALFNYFPNFSTNINMPKLFSRLFGGEYYRR